MPVPEHRSVVVWTPPNERPEVIEKRAHEEKLKKAREAEAAARLALAQAKEMQAGILAAGAKLVLSQLEKYIRLSESPDFENTVGPLEPETILKLAEMVFKNHRLETGQATENVAVAIGASIDFSKLSQEQRDQWRDLYLKGGGSPD